MIGRTELEPVPYAGPPPRYVCDHCEQSFEGYSWGSGLFIWTRGDEVRYEEPPLCEPCALRLSAQAIVHWRSEVESE